MADQKLTELTELTSVSADDILYIVDDPSGSPLSRKISAQNLINGWIGADAMTYGSADDPTYTMTCSGDQTTKYYVGQRIKLTQATGGTKYFIITKVEYSAPNTVITMYGGTDYNLENEAISSPYYSLMKAPAGFPLSPLKWTVEVTDNATRTQATPGQNTWYNLNSNAISVPIGCWRIYYRAMIQASDSTSAGWYVYSTLSTANNSESDTDFTNGFVASNVYFIIMSGTAEKIIDLSSKTSYYLNLRTTSANLDNMYLRGDLSKTIIRAICAYL